MKTIIFDIDGTLTDTKEVDDKCFITAFQNEFDLDIRSQNWSAFKNVTDWGITEEIFLNELNRIPTDNEYKLLKEEFIQQLKIGKDRDPSQFFEVNGAKNFLSHLRRLGYPLGIATGGWEDSARLKLDAAGIELDGLGFSNSSRYKTRHGIINDVMNQLAAGNKFEPTDIIYFGDGMWDLLTCHKMGIHFIGIDYDGDQKLKNAGVFPVYKDFSYVDEIMDIINNGGFGVRMIDLDF